MWSNEFAHRAAVGVGFGAVATISRQTILSVETRVQILAFVILAVLYELAARPHFGQRSRGLGVAVNAGLATAAILATRWHLEGLCPGVRRAGCLPFP